MTIDIPLQGTPVEEYCLAGKRVLVKREDMACLPPGPPFSKMRGVFPALLTLKKAGATHVHYVETSVSMAGWGIAYCCHLIGLHCVLYDPQYAHPPELLVKHRGQWRLWGAEVRPIPSGRAKVAWYAARKGIKDIHHILLPLGIPFDSTVTATAKEASTTIHQTPCAVVVVCIGSGTIAAGVLRATSAARIPLYGVMSRSGDVDAKRDSILMKGGVVFGRGGLAVIDDHWEYAELAPGAAPFPCHPYYDLKAWCWLEKNIQRLPQPVMFWNIGASI
jgi:threonine dehydratase